MLISQKWVKGEQAYSYRYQKTVTKDQNILIDQSVNAIMEHSPQIIK